MKYSEGDIVHVKLEGLTVTGIIKKVSKKNSSYTIQFDGGAEKEILERRIKGVDGKATKNEISEVKPEPRSPSRRSPSRRSPARNASPSRRTRASPSPSRRKSPSRKSTSRVLKVSLENVESLTNSGSGDQLSSFPRRRKPIEQMTEVFSSVTETITEKISKVNNKLDNSKSDKDISSYSDDLERIVHLKNAESILNDIEAYSDDDVLDTKASEVSRKSEPKSLIPPREFGGWFGALLLIFLIPLSTLTLHVLCNKDFCNFTKLPNLNKYKLLNAFIDVKTIILYFGYYVLMTLFSLLPYCGKQISSQPSKDKKYMYRMNGLFSAVTIFGVIIALESQDISVVDYITTKYFQFLTTAIIFGFISSVLLFVRSKFIPVSLLNPHAVTYNFIYDFFMGREVNPKIWRIDFKTLLLRACYISILIMDSAYVYKSLNVSVSNNNLFSFDNISFDPVLLICASLQMLYAFDLLAFEWKLTTTFELQYEGLGYMKVMLYAVYPYLATVPISYIYNHREQVVERPWLLALAGVVFFTGYVLYRGSNSQKNAFRLNPYDPALAHLECIPTTLGKKLLVSGYWGKVRRPNYVGEFLMLVALVMICPAVPMFLSSLILVLHNVYRAIRDEQRCKRRYGAAWDRYTIKVRHMFVPKVI